jgi:hypothetical protein
LSKKHLLLLKIKIMEKKYKRCQSCGLTIGKGGRKRGTEFDGITKSPMYCAECYQLGQFLQGNRMTVYEFQELCRRALVEDGNNRLVAWLRTRGMRHLERWN